ncbi:MAG TPA: hypothetical protein VHY22_16885 [Chthoniobacteraceae bacterium]|nr:hypothetical protein [Chthoniobacteraceae bacterium]
MKSFLIGLLFALLLGSGLMAQTVTTGYRAPSAEPAASPAKKNAADKAPSGPTVIDSKDTMDYDGNTRVAVFTGDNYGVLVKDPSFVVYCDKLTAYMRKGGAAQAPGAKGSPGAKRSPAASPAPQGKAAAAQPRGNGLQRAVAEGPPDRPVVIVQDKPATNGQEAQHDVGIAEKADYNTDTGDIKLTGWPRVSQGINTQVATSPKTIMIMNRDGRTMRTIGPSHSVIEEQQPAKKDSDSSPSETPTHSAK